MNIKTLALSLFVGTLSAACIGQARPATPTAPKSAMAPTVAAKVAGLSGVRADLILRSSAYALDRSLSVRDVLTKLRAMQHPATRDFEPGAASMSNVWTQRLQQVMGVTNDGRQTRTVEDIAKDPKAMKVMQAFQAWQAQRLAAMQKAAADYKKVFGDARRVAPAPAQSFDAVLRIYNDGASPLVLWEGGDMQKVNMRLTGPGAISILAAQDLTEIFMMGRKVTVAPGGHVDLPITALRYGNRTHQLAAYATTTGAYSLDLSWSTQMQRGGGRSTVSFDFPAVAFDVK